jgi:serine phosphatase RsbU (regulator of sigma subunit)
MMNQTDAERMECMEVWGGNRAIDRSFETPGLKIWVHSRPFGQAAGGGDVYYFSSCASGRITRMLLADISGHGAEVTQLAIKLRDLMRRNVNYVKQTRFVRAMTQQFGDMGEQGIFATALVATFFAPTRSFALCNAGHPAPLVFRRSKSEWAELATEDSASEAATDMPLGITRETTYCQLSVRLETGDRVLSFSDAVTESQDAEGRQLGRRGVLRLARELRMADPAELIPALVEKITGLRDDNLTQDDATILLCQATGGGPSLQDNLLAPFRLLGLVADRTRLG